GIIVRSGGAAGGDDVIALIGAKITPLKINHVYMITDLIVLALSLTYLNFEQIFFSIIAVTISGKIIGIMYNDGCEEEELEEEIDFVEGC
ncbi:MAG: YitT family protein, partial [Romboutsia sp.]|uniref:YitT family protein n=1 Tax=Romboutsia sp. TaxID=1965302 RepID=UPI003F3F108C